MVGFALGFIDGFILGLAEGTADDDSVACNASTTKIKYSMP